MVRARRVKRAGEGTLYSGCLAGQDCPDDIKAKFEQNTLADKFLKWISSFVYFGNLGISTGRGSGGSTGYVPLRPGISGTGRAGARPGMGAAPSRPSIPVESVGPGDLPTISGTVDATAPSVITPGESTVIVTGDGTSVDEIPLVPQHPDVPPVDPNHTIHDPSVHLFPPSTDGGPAILDLSLTIDPANPSTASSNIPGVALDTSVEVPLFPTTPLEPLDIALLPVESSFISHTVISGPDVFEDIELDVLGGDITPPKSSTPSTHIRDTLSSVRRAYNRRTSTLRRYYHRLTQQVRVSSSQFLKDPSKLVQYEYSNPAYDPEASLDFPQSEHTVTMAPDPAFQDIASLGHPIIYSEGGYVRVSRLGARETIRTRSGAAIGPRVHFYTDLSTISHFSDLTSTDISVEPHVDDSGMELHVFGESHGDLSIVDTLNSGQTSFYGDNSSSIIGHRVGDGSIHSEYSDTSLLDSYSDAFQHGHLAFSDLSHSVSIIPVPQPSRPVSFFPESIGGLDVHYPISTVAPTSLSPSFITNTDDIPSIVIVHTAFGGGSFFLHPSLLKRKRKRVFY